MQIKNFEPWVWTELLAFDRDAADRGVKAYLDELGFVPQGLCLLLSSPDFILSYPGRISNRQLPADVCARNGQAGNERRQRQNWSDLDLKMLIENLTGAGCEVYCSCFTVFQENRFTHEYLSDHEEVRLCWADHWRGQELNVLAQMSDGSLFEDYVVQKITEVCRDFGFAGWHGPDGWGPWGSGNICGVDFSDSMIGQFAAATNLDLPEIFQPMQHVITMQEVHTARSEGREPDLSSLKILQQRRDWICKNCFKEWRDFLSDRWCGFLGKVLDALHKINCKGIINSAWTKGCFDALNEYAIDYRRLAALGLDAMVVETVALSMNSTRPHNHYYHDFYAAALTEIKAAVPDLKLIALHGIKDVDEFWDNLRHAPAGYEKEMYKLGNMFVCDAQGKLHRAASGFLCCLADGIEKSEWDFIRQRWQAVFDHDVSSAGVLTAVYSDRYVESFDDYWSDGFTPALDQTSHLMEAGAAVQSFVHADNIAAVNGPLFVPSAHLWEREKLDMLSSEHNHMVILCGRSEILNYLPGWKITDNSITIVIPAVGEEEIVYVKSPVPAQTSPDHNFTSFAERRYRKPVAAEFWQLAAAKINELLQAKFPRVTASKFPATVLCKYLDENTAEIAVENRAEWGRNITEVKLPFEFESAEIKSTFPSRLIRSEVNSFTIPVPPRGVTAVRVKLKKHS